jgi:hypothetical protein
MHAPPSLLRLRRIPVSLPCFSKAVKDGRAGLRFFKSAQKPKVFEKERTKTLVKFFFTNLLVK